MSKKIVIEPKTEMHEVWLKLMLNIEIKDTEGAISNERLWQKGSEGEAVLMHEMNIRELIGYKELLEEALKTLTEKGDTHD